MTDLEAIHRAILDEPHVELRRSIYADCLEDLGTPASLARAEFVRVQLEYAAT